MAILAPTFEQISPSRGVMRVEKVGGGAVTITVPNADLLAAFAAGTPLGDLVRRTVANNTAASGVMFGQASDSQAPQGKIYFNRQAAGAAGLPPRVTALEAAGVITLEVESIAAAGTWAFYIENVSSLVR